MSRSTGRQFSFQSLSLKTLLLILALVTVTLFAFRDLFQQPGNLPEAPHPPQRTMGVHTFSSTHDLIPHPKDGLPTTLPAVGMRGVLLFLYGGRWHDYFVQHTLPSLEAYYLQCFPHRYPIHIFYESLTPTAMAEIRTKVPSALRVDFEDISALWSRLPHNISEDRMRQWVAAQPKFQGRGYRLMCRFWAGLAWQLPSMDRYTHYWRLDTDSILRAPVLHDPFEVMAHRGCEYGFNRLKGENPHVIPQLGASFTKWARANLPSTELKKVLALTHDDKGQFWGPMFYNNFELGTFRLKRSERYRSLFKYIDERPPFGILQFRWGDAPIHTLGVYSALGGSDEKMCNFSKSDVPYGHAVKRPPPIETGRCIVK